MLILYADSLYLGEKGGSEDDHDGGGGSNAEGSDEEKEVDGGGGGLNAESIDEEKEVDEEVLYEKDEETGGDEDDDGDSPHKKAKVATKEYKNGDTVRMHMRDDDDNEVVYFGKIRGNRKNRVLEEGQPLADAFFYYKLHILTQWTQRTLGVVTNSLNMGLILTRRIFWGRFRGEHAHTKNAITIWEAISMISLTSFQRI